MLSALSRLFRAAPAAPSRPVSRPRFYRPQLEVLEDRLALTAAGLLPPSPAGLPTPLVRLNPEPPAADRPVNLPPAAPIDPRPRQPAAEVDAVWFDWSPLGE
ncbi:MAG TPA: hypothetical protein VFA26_09885 [Gemmataceae bacterium]|nr:hypothetical protein [Gemmataceae bacterium]